MTNLKHLSVSQLYPHPSNPRKDLGDLTELVESIKANGILQNLTVVPWFDENPEAQAEEPKQPMDERYRVVIGHRRLAAAKLAGCKTVPCVEAQMDQKQQLRTMLMENIQRSDLTIYEQAQGFQMMLDLGETVKSVAKETGISESTVRHRVKLMELDPKKLKKAESRGATLQDYMALEKIQDPDRKNKVLDVIGTQNFQSELRKAQDQEREETRKRNIVNVLKTFATQIEDSEASDLKVVQHYSFYRDEEVKKPDDSGQRKYFFRVSYNITLYTEQSEQDQERKAALNAVFAKKCETNERLNQLAARAFQLRFDFVKGLTGCAKKKAVICEIAVRAMSLTGYRHSINRDMFLSLLNIKADRNEDLDISQIQQAARISPEQMLLFISYAKLGDDSCCKYHNYNNIHQENPTVGLVYECLDKLGYQMSDEERAYQDGTHELFDEPDQPAAAS